MYTPWGKADHQRKIADGITSYYTPSHGGYHLSESRLAQLPPELAAHKPFAGERGWYEEDCDWVIVVLGFASYFPADQVEAAREAVRANPQYYPTITKVPVEAERVEQMAWPKFGEDWR